MLQKTLVLDLPPAEQRPTGQLVELTCPVLIQRFCCSTLVRTACRKTFSSLEGLRQHMRIAHGVRYADRAHVIDSTAEILTGNQLTSADAVPDHEWDFTADGIPCCFVPGLNLPSN